MDRRMTPFSGRVAHVSLRGMVEAPLTEGEAAFVVAPLVDLLSRPDGPRDRQLLLGDAVTVIDRDQGHAFVLAAKDGYCGWMAEAAVGPADKPTHWVASPATHVYPETRVQSRERMALSFGARLAVVGEAGAWVETTLGFVPASHLRRIGDWMADPVAVAETMLGTPYLWGGNSRAGLDCSGLAQLSLQAVGLACPGDSDLQRALGVAIPDGRPLRRGDLLFWKGHVALVVGPDQIIHANGQTMSVAYEGINAAVDRIGAQGGGPVIARRRV
jgi:cell wall-associated NlpC family hydrolase